MTNPNNPPPMVYIAGPFSAKTREGVDENILRATLVGLEVAKLGGYPVIPHANTAHPEFEEVQPYQFWIMGTLAQLRTCDALMLVHGWENSDGARGERADAFRLGLQVFYPDQLKELGEWIQIRRGQ